MRDDLALRATLHCLAGCGILDRAFTSHDQRSWERWRHAPEVYR